MFCSHGRGSWNSNFVLWPYQSRASSLDDRCHGGIVINGSGLVCDDFHVPSLGLEGHDWEDLV